MTDTTIGIIDRIVDGETAVLLVEAGEETTDEFALAVTSVPEEGRHEGAAFEVTIESGTVRELTYRPEVERNRRETAQDRLDDLSKRLDDQ